jgi:hypothetical protein
MLTSLLYRWQSSKTRLRRAFSGATRPHLESLPDRLATIRQHCQKEQCFSWTSPQYQNDLVQFLTDHQQQGSGVVEVGCFRGGLSVQLACVCQFLGWPFYTMDVEKTFLQQTGQLLKRFGLHRHAVLFHGPLDQFVKKTRLHDRPALSVIDGDHRYDAVLQDIDALCRLNRVPYAAAFHDYSLRHTTIDERVDAALQTRFGAGTVIRKIGTQFRAGGDHPTRQAPASDGHYWDTPGSEGAIVVLP